MKYRLVLLSYALLLFLIPQLPTYAEQTSIFTQPLYFGARGEEVRMLQQFLSQNGFTTAKNGPGSTSNETTFYGERTAQAVRTFQCTYKIICEGNAVSTGYGVVGPRTRKTLNAIVRGDTAVLKAGFAIPHFPPPGPTDYFHRALFFGMDNSDILTLQKLLNENGFVLAKSGPGSPGNETTFYGHLTANAVRRFQCAHDIICSGDNITTGHGVVGPKTRVKLNAIFGPIIPIPPPVQDLPSTTLPPLPPPPPPF